MNKIIEKIQNSAFLNISNRVLGTLDPLYVFLSLAILFASVFTNGLPWVNGLLLLYIPLVVPVISGLCVFVMALRIGRQSSSDELDRQAVIIAMSTVVSLIPILINAAQAPYALFLGFILALVYKLIYVILGDIRLKAKSIPPAVRKTLTSLIPDFGLAVITVGWVMLLVQSSNAFVEILHSFFGLVGSFPVILLVVIAICYIWTMGHHGANTVNRIMRLFWVPMALVNLVTFTTTGKPMYIGVEGLITTFVWMGGSGGTLGLAIVIKLFTKSLFMKEIAKESLIPGFFNINEPIIFGVPIVENKRYLIPFFLAPITMISLSYWMIALDYVRFPAYAITWIMPGPLAALIGSFFDYRALLLSLALIVLSGLIYLPFVLKHDKDLLNQERVMN